MGRIARIVYNFRIQYYKGNKNAKADALSRRADYQDRKESNIFAILKVDRNSIIPNKVEIAATIIITNKPFFR